MLVDGQVVDKADFVRSFSGRRGANLSTAAPLQRYCANPDAINPMPSAAEPIARNFAPPDAGERVSAGLPSSVALEAFLRGVERRALRMADLATGSRDEALDVVQDAMFGFVRHYAAKPAGDWLPLFYRVLDNRLNDWHRRRRVRSRWIDTFLGRGEDDADRLAQAEDASEPGPPLRLAGSETARALDAALAALPTRQRQAFLLRVWEGLDVADTARAMRCSQGSVKTHLSRALAALRRALGDHR
jgi:RNA polymerase sigma-70 factor, ECF subfamily